MLKIETSVDNVVPENVVDQLFLWEKEENRVTYAPAVLLKLPDPSVFKSTARRESERAIRPRRRHRCTETMDPPALFTTCRDASRCGAAVADPNREEGREERERVIPDAERASNCRRSRSQM